MYQTLKKNLKTIRYILIVPAIVLLLVISTGQSDYVRPSGGAPGGSATAEEALPGAETAQPLPTPAELQWIYPEGWVDYSDLPRELDLSSGELLLVNDLHVNNLLRDTYIPRMNDIEYGFRFHVRGEQALRDFLAAARAEGYAVNMTLSYRSYYRQNIRFNGIASGIADGQEVDYATAVERARAVTAFPGTDEHQTGLAVNFADDKGNDTATNPVIRWMTEHCWEYGFILRYPADKEEVTGRLFEPNHFRYVGETAAEYIMRKGITLEEFLQAYEEEEA